MELKLKNVKKIYGKQVAIDNFNYEFKEGIYGILGANGAGKTTLLKMLSTILEPTEGKIFWNHKNIFAKQSEYRSIIGVLPQNMGYYEDFLVKDFIHFIGTLKGCNKKKIEKEIDYVLEPVNLLNEKDKKMGELSGGMRQRVGIAQSLLNNPQVLILDEPTVGLDPEERGNFRTVLTNISSNRIILLSTHIVQDIEYVANEIIIMKQGKILVSGSRNNILKSVEEKIWECDDIEKNNHVILCNQRNENDKIISRVISNECPGENAKKVSPCLDDVYLYFNALESYKEL